MHRKWLWLVTGVVSASLLVACGGGGGGGNGAGAAGTGGTATSIDTGSSDTGAGSGSGTSGTGTGSGQTPAVSAFKAFDPVVVNSGTPSQWLAAARLADGTNVVVWSAAQDTQLWARRTDGGGAFIGEPFRVDDASTSYPLRGAAVTALPSGGFVVAWAQETVHVVTPGAVATAVFSRRFAADGSPAAGSQQVAPDLYALVTSITIKPVADGGWVVGWIAEPVRVAPDYAMFQRYAGSGAKAGPLVKIAPDTQMAQQQLSLAPLPDGSVAAVWVQPVPGGYALAMRTFDAASVSTGDMLLLAGTTSTTPINGSAAGLPNGNIAVAWTLVRESNAGEVRSMVVTPAGTVVGATSSETSRLQVGDVTVTALGNQGYAVFWQMPDGNYRSSNETLTYSVHDSTGAITAATQLGTRTTYWISATTGDSVSAGSRIAVDGGTDGHFILAYQQADSTANTYLMGR